MLKIGFYADTNRKSICRAVSEDTTKSGRHKLFVRPTIIKCNIPGKT